MVNKVNVSWLFFCVGHFKQRKTGHGTRKLFLKYHSMILKEMFSAFGWCPSSSIVRRTLTSSPQKPLGQSLPNLVSSICRGSTQEIVNFMTPTPQGF